MNALQHFFKLIKSVGNFICKSRTNIIIICYGKWGACASLYHSVRIAWNSVLSEIRFSCAADNSGKIYMTYAQRFKVPKDLFIYTAELSASISCEPSVWNIVLTFIAKDTQKHLINYRFHLNYKKCTPGIGRALSYLFIYYQLRIFLKS